MWCLVSLIPVLCKNIPMIIKDMFPGIKRTLFTPAFSFNVEEKRWNESGFWAINYHKKTHRFITVLNISPIIFLLEILQRLNFFPSLNISKDISLEYGKLNIRDAIVLEYAFFAVKQTGVFSEVSLTLTSFFNAR